MLQREFDLDFQQSTAILDRPIGHLFAAVISSDCTEISQAPFGGAHNTPAADSHSALQQIKDFPRLRLFRLPCFFAFASR